MLKNLTRKVADCDGTVGLDGGEGGNIATLGEGDAACIEDDGTLGGTVQAPEMDVAVAEEVDAEGRTVVGRVFVAVGQEYAFAIVDEEGVIGHARELQEHLIDLGVAIATHGNDTVGQGIEAVGDTYAVDALGDGVARAVVDDVAEDDEEVVLLLGEELEDLLKARQGAVDIGEEEVFHWN